MQWCQHFHLIYLAAELFPSWAHRWSSWTAQCQSGKFSSVSTAEKKLKILLSFSSCKAKPEWWITSFRTDIYRFFGPTAHQLQKMPQMLLCSFFLLLVFQVTSGHFAGGEVKSCSVRHKWKKCFILYALHVCYWPVSIQDRKEENKTRKRDKRKGLSSSDLVMKCCGTKAGFLKETWYSLVGIK